MSEVKMTTVSPNSLNRGNTNRSAGTGDASSRWFKCIFGVGAFCALVFFVASISRETSDPAIVQEIMTQQSAAADSSISVVKSAGGVSSGHLSHGDVNGVAYYHCAAHTPATTRDVILLHGAKFTKEDWKRSTIMPRLCAHGHLSVTALDLPVNAGATTFQDLLRGLALGEGVLQPEGNYVVVTPSASGHTLVDWINTGDLDELTDQVGLWIPIASPAIASAQADKLQDLKERSWPILALYGDKDARGKKLSEQLKTRAGARVKEFPGPHAFYFDMAESFSKYVQNELHVTRA